jgi:hypothetical protein
MSSNIALDGQQRCKRSGLQRANGDGARRHVGSPSQRAGTYALLHELDFRGYEDHRAVSDGNASAISSLTGWSMCSLLLGVRRDGPAPWHAGASRSALTTESHGAPRVLNDVALGGGARHA